ncbi:MAG TPA: hypothetical protein VKR06_35950 [Ktedonosporobacter sp.]|nr:hypothetical protein [Ktedonosporobacter sp.]
MSSEDILIHLARRHLCTRRVVPKFPRTPIYTGLLGMLVGSLLIARGGEWVVGVAAALILLEVKIVLEERLLLATFGEQYVQFKRQVPQLIPFTRWGRS